MNCRKALRLRASPARRRCQRYCAIASSIGRLAVGRLPAAVDDRRRRRAKALAQVDEVVERDALAAVDGDGPVGVLAHGRRVVCRDGRRRRARRAARHPAGAAQADLVVALAQRRIALDRDRQGPCGQLSARRRGSVGPPRRTGGQVARRTAEAWVAHDRESSARLGASPVGHADDPAATMRCRRDETANPSAEGPGERRLPGRPRNAIGRRTAGRAGADGPTAVASRHAGHALARGVAVASRRVVGAPRRSPSAGGAPADHRRTARRRRALGWAVGRRWSSRPAARCRPARRRVLAAALARRRRRARADRTVALRPARGRCARPRRLPRGDVRCRSSRWRSLLAAAVAWWRAR